MNTFHIDINLGDCTFARLVRCPCNQVSIVTLSMFIRFGSLGYWIPWHQMLSNYGLISSSTSHQYRSFAAILPQLYSVMDLRWFPHVALQRCFEKTSQVTNQKEISGKPPSKIGQTCQAQENNGSKPSNHSKTLQDCYVGLAAYIPIFTHPFKILTLILHPLFFGDTFGHFRRRPLPWTSPAALTPYCFAKLFLGRLAASA